MALNFGGSEKGLSNGSLSIPHLKFPASSLLFAFGILVQGGFAHGCLKICARITSPKLNHDWKYWQCLITSRSFDAYIPQTAQIAMCHFWRRSCHRQSCLALAATLNHSGVWRRSEVWLESETAGSCFQKNRSQVRDGDLKSIIRMVLKHKMRGHRILVSLTRGIQRMFGGCQPIAAPVRNIPQRGDDFADEEQHKSIKKCTMKEVKAPKNS